MQKILITLLIVTFLLTLACGLVQKDGEGFKDLVGKGIQEFEKIAASRGAGVVRIVEADGVSRYLTKDLRLDRLNVKVKTISGNHVVEEIVGFF